MPKVLERCIKKVQKKVKPRKGQNKKSAAYGICTSSLQKAGKMKKKPKRTKK